MGSYLLIKKSLKEESIDNINKFDLINNLKFKDFENTSSTKLEIETVLWALSEFQRYFPNFHNINIKIYTDSQCVAGLLRRRENLEKKNFISSSQNKILNHSELYKKFYDFFDILNFEVIKLDGHCPKNSHDIYHRIFSIIDQEVRKRMKLNSNYNNSNENRFFNIL